MKKIGDNYITDDGVIITQADIDALPDLSLCDECKALGYCRKEGRQLKPDFDMLNLMDTTEVERMIPWGVLEHSFTYLGNYTKKHMKIALEAFHQQDYETAILHSKVVLEQNPYRTDALLCIAASEFFSNNFQMAMELATTAIGQDFLPTAKFTIERFIYTCENLLSRNKQETNRESGRSFFLPLVSSPNGTISVGEHTCR